MKLIDWFKRKPRPEPACTPEQAARIWADCWAANAHEDELFDEYNALCRKERREFSFNGFFVYAGRHWRLDYDPYGYKKAWLDGSVHPYVETLD